jgi:hypothetical protein
MSVGDFIFWMGEAPPHFVAGHAQIIDYSEWDGRAFNYEDFEGALNLGFLAAVQGPYLLFDITYNAGHLGAEDCIPGFFVLTQKGEEEFLKEKTLRVLSDM